MQVLTTSLPEVKLFQLKFFGDDRGFFAELWNFERYREFGLQENFVQINVSKSSRGVLRGLHFQEPEAQGKLVTVLEGAVYDVAVDVRWGSPHFGKSFGVELSLNNHYQMYIPPGFAHGFVVLSDTALFAYACTHFYRPQHEHSMLWNDPALGIAWPIASPELSGKDAKGKLLSEFSKDELPKYVAK